ncbi:MAG: hypothetical protein WBD95_22620, partial [Xanthobacteraceae bacterium]
SIETGCYVSQEGMIDLSGSVEGLEITAGLRWQVDNLALLSASAHGQKCLETKTVPRLLAAQ